jgi:hypothetical protein
MISIFGPQRALAEQSPASAGPERADAGRSSAEAASTGQKPARFGASADTKLTAFYEHFAESVSVEAWFWHQYLEVEFVRCEPA